MAELEAAIKKLDDDLTWRGPTTGKPLGHIVLKRETAQVIHAKLQDAAKPSYQLRTQKWLHACFEMDHIMDPVVRAHRFLEEALELVQSVGVPAADCQRLIEYVYGRPPGNVGQEIGGCQITLVGVAYAKGYDMHLCGETELKRVWDKIDIIRRKQQQKPNFSKDPLPGNADDDRLHPDTPRI